MPKHLRLDAELVRRGLVQSRAEARLAIEEGLVTVNGVEARRLTTLVAPDTPVAVTAPPKRFVSRGGDKLEGALERLPVAVGGKRWLDAGASTGGFTDCLLQRGALEVAAVDVGYGQLAWSLRNDPRVTVLERINVRELTAEILPWSPDGVVADLSFISLRLVLPALVQVVDERGSLLLMVKPQFEVGRALVGKGGVVRDESLWRASLEGVVEAAAALGWNLKGATASSLPGPAGNREFFILLDSSPGHDEGCLERAVAEAGGG